MHRRPETGAATAEVAVVLPTVVLLALSLGWLVSLGVTQVRVVDAARETARAAARSDADAVGLGRRVAPDGASVSVERSADHVVVRVSATVRGPGGLLASLGAPTVSSEAVAAVEPTW